MDTLKAGAAIAVIASVISLFFFDFFNGGGNVVVGLSIFLTILSQLAVVIVYHNLGGRRKKATGGFVHFEDAPIGKLSRFLFAYSVSASAVLVAVSIIKDPFFVGTVSMCALGIFMSWAFNKGTREIFDTEAKERDEIYKSYWEEKNREEKERQDAKAKREEKERKEKAEREEKKRQEKARQEKAAFDEAMRRTGKF